MLQLDEPALPAVLVGDVPTASGFGALRAVEEQLVRSGLAEVLEAATGAGAVQTVVHCCAPHPPVTLFREAGAGAVSFDLALRSAADDELLGSSVEAGVGLWLGVVPAGSADDPAVLGDLGDTVRSVRGLWSRLGFAAELLPGAVVLTPACGLAGTTPAYAGPRSVGSAKRPARSSRTPKADPRAGTARVRTAQAGTAQAGTAQAGTAQAGTAQAGTAQAGTAQAGTARARTARVGRGAGRAGRDGVGRAGAGRAAGRDGAGRDRVGRAGAGRERVGKASGAAATVPV